MVRVLPLLAVAGCASVQPLRDPAQFIAETTPPTVYAIHKNGALLTIAQPRVVGDSLVGTWQGADQQLALPFDDLQRVEAVQRDKTRTIMLISGVTAVSVVVGYFLTRETSDVRQPCGFEGAQQMSGCEYYDP
jgi:hypothetical protein